MKIELITEDFKGSDYGSNTDCPLARALKRYFPNKKVSVGGSYIKLKGRGYNFNDNLWSFFYVDEMIYKANSGEEVSYSLEIVGL